METLLYQVANLSSGVLSTLTGHRRYEDLDRIQIRFFEWTQKQIESGCLKPTDTWVEAWNKFKAEEDKS